MLEAKGTFSSGMGRPPAEGYALFGAIVPVGGERVLTVKMTGPEADVEPMRQDFLDYCKSLKFSSVLQSDRVSDQK